MKVFIAEATPRGRAALVNALGGLPDFRVVGEADSVRSAIAGILDKKPDIALLGLKLAGGSGLQVLQDIHAREPAIDCYIVSNFDSPALANYADRVGAVAFFSRTAGLEALRAQLASRAMQAH